MIAGNAVGNGAGELKILVAGIGGQGVVFATRLLANTAIGMGFPVMASETHGMSQRGGSVISHLKLGGPKAPLIRKGTADLLLALDATEGLRNLAFVRAGGAVFLNAEDGFSGDISEHLARRQVDLYSYPAGRTALELGAPAVANVALIGFAAAFPALRLPLESIERTLRESASRQLEVNLKALHLGNEAGRKAIHSSPAQPGSAEA